MILKALQNFLLFIYIILFILQIVLLVKAVKKFSKKRWIILYVFEIVSLVLSYLMFCIYNHPTLLNLPLDSFMPGLTYISGTVFSFGAFVMYAVITVVTVISNIIKHISINKNNTP